jgi:protein-S-isoprenylcysteine O-methyltransferase Ste14
VRLLLKNALFTLVIPGTVGVYMPLWLNADRPLRTNASNWLGALLIGAGAGMYGASVWAFATLGRGTPAPIDAPKKLVVRGLYRHTRNPMYVGVLTVILGWAVLFRAGTLLIYAAVVAACFEAFVVFYEEPHLARGFGDEYERYKRRVGRWLWR